MCLARGENVVNILDDGDVDGGEGTRTVDLFGCHDCEYVNARVVVLIV